MNLTLNEIKEHLRYDNDDTSNDSTLNSYLLASEQVIKNFINKEIDINTKPDIKVAQMLLIGYWDDNRNAEIESINFHRLPYPVQILLQPYRTPVSE